MQLSLNKIFILNATFKIKHVPKNELKEINYLESIDKIVKEK